MVIIDAGPALNFLATHNERILLGVVGGYLSAPETVEDEVITKASRDNRLRDADPVWRKLRNANRITVLSDTITPELNRAVTRLANMPMAQRMRHSKDLGETMVVAHGAVLAESGAVVRVLIDDGGAAAMAQNERRRLERLRAQGQAVGTIGIYSTPTILEAAVPVAIDSKAKMRDIYEQLRRCDDGLVHISQTRLLSSGIWSPSA